MDAFFPRLIINETIARQNVIRMTEKATKNKVSFRPHFKTHQSHTAGKWIREAGVKPITVSSLKMAKYFMESGWKDIFIAFPVNILETSYLNDIAAKIKLSVSVESLQVAKHLKKNLSNSLGVYIKIDCGYHRTGLPSNAFDEISSILQQIHQSECMDFIGFYTHSGHSYQSQNKNEIIKIHEFSVQQLTVLKNRFQKDFPNLILSVGDTPCCCTVDNFEGVDEIRPGNFVFFDLMQLNLGVCTFEDIAIVLECPIVAKHKERNEIIIHGGAVHLSKESIFYQGQELYGKIVKMGRNGWGKPLNNTYVKSLSQEHGIIKTVPSIFNQVEVGETLGIIPVHSCLTANLADTYFDLNSNSFSKMRS